MEDTLSLYVEYVPSPASKLMLTPIVPTELPSASDISNSPLMPSSSRSAMVNSQVPSTSSRLVVVDIAVRMGCVLLECGAWYRVPVYGHGLLGGGAITYETVVVDLDKSDVVRWRRR